MSRPQWTIAASDAGTRLDKFLAAPDRLGSRAKVVTALERGKVFLNEVECTLADASTRLVADDLVRLWIDRPGSATRRPGPRKTGALDILYEDDALIVLNKPAGLLSVPLERRSQSPSIVTLLEDYFRSSGKRKPFVVHRIDLDTSGLVLFAKTTLAQQRLKDQFRRREPDRVYWAVVYGHPDPPQGTWRDRLVWDTKALIQKETHPNDPSGVDAVSNYRVVERFAETSLVEVRLETGKRNQIRIQARLRGHTLVGETRYVYGPDALRPLEFPRQALHARRLGFRHPADDRPLEFEAPLPRDMTELLARLRQE
ncbi:MAG TPA: RluA family pseudouridine synthase [Vicinamibacterales bacterium]|nr:RluA family pseudouridine synthase [Vicinamibacterales bacterium]